LLIGHYYYKYNNIAWALIHLNIVWGYDKDNLVVWLYIMYICATFTICEKYTILLVSIYFNKVACLYAKFTKYLELKTKCFLCGVQVLHLNFFGCGFCFVIQFAKTKVVIFALWHCVYGFLRLLFATFHL